MIVTIDKVSNSTVRKNGWGGVTIFSFQLKWTRSANRCFWSGFIHFIVLGAAHTVKPFILKSSHTNPFGRLYFLLHSHMHLHHISTHVFSFILSSCAIHLSFISILICDLCCSYVLVLQLVHSNDIHVHHSILVSATSNRGKISFCGLYNLSGV